MNKKSFFLIAPIITLLASCASTGKISDNKRFVEWQGTTYWTQGRDSAILGRFGSKQEQGKASFHPEEWLKIPQDAINTLGPYKMKIIRETLEDIAVGVDIKQIVEVTPKGDIKYANKGKREVEITFVTSEVNPSVLKKVINASQSSIEQLEDMIQRKELPRTIFKNIIILDHKSKDAFERNANLSLSVSVTQYGDAKFSWVDKKSRETALEFNNPVVRGYSMGCLRTKNETDGLRVFRILPDVPGESDCKNKG